MVAGEVQLGHRHVEECRRPELQKQRSVQVGEPAVDATQELHGPIAELATAVPVSNNLGEVREQVKEDVLDAGAVVDRGLRSHVEAALLGRNKIKIASEDSDRLRERTKKTTEPAKLIPKRQSGNLNQMNIDQVQRWPRTTPASKHKNAPTDNLEWLKLGVVGEEGRLQHDANPSRSPSG